MRSIIKHPFAREHITALRSHSPLTRHRRTVNPCNSPTTIVPRGVALTESIQNLYNPRKPTNTHQTKTTNQRHPSKEINPEFKSKPTKKKKKKKKIKVADP